MSCHPLTPEENFIKAIALLHDLSITESDVNELYADWAARSQKHQRATYYAKQSADYWGVDYDIQSSRVLNLVVSTAIGFLTGGPLGAAIGLLGSATSFFSGRGGGGDQGSVEDESFNQSRGFENGGALAPSGALMPMLYGSRAIDPDGGVRVGGILIHSRIETLLGTNMLYQLYAISDGESAATGWGQLGLIDEAEALFNNQPRSNFTAAEITTFSRNGTQAQTAIPEFPFYSQVLTPPDYAVFGVDLRGEVNEVTGIDQQNTNSVNVVFAGNAVTKVAPGLPNVYDAGFFSTAPVNSGGFLQFTAGQVGTERAIGLSNTDIDTNFNSIEFGWYLNAAGAFVTENGNLQFGPIAYNAASVFRVEITQQARYRLNGQLIYTSAIAPAAPLFADAAFFTLGSTLTNITTSSEPGGVAPTVAGQTTFIVDEDDLALYDPSEDYSLCDGLIGTTATDFRIIAKDSNANTVTADQNLNLNAGDEIYAYWISKFENTKRVTRTDFNLAFNVTSRDPEDGTTNIHAVGFDVWMRAVTTPLGTEQFIVRFFVRSKNPSVIRRGFRVINQPLGRYYYEFRPICSPICDRLAFELTDSGQLQAYNSGVPLAGVNVVIEGEFEVAFDPASPDANDRCDLFVRYFSYEDKISVSSEQGPTGKISSVNEIVDPTVINIPAGGGANPYPGIATQGYQFLASERLQSPPGTRTFAREARICPNLMSAGDASILSAATVLNDPTANFAADGVQVGMIIRNLTRKVEAQITTFTPTTITTGVALNWAERDRYVVWILASTAYFPDVYADAIANDLGGIRTLVDPDEYIDYPSLVRSRQFCVANNFYWNGIIERGTPFVQWATAEVIGSRLFPSRVDGRFGLIPDEITPIEHTFNASNTRNVREEWADWQPTIVNRLVVVYTDGRDLFTQDGIRFREKTITISTVAAFNGTEPPREEELSLRHVSNPAQATSIGATYLKSLRLQNRGVQFETSYHAAFLQAGQLISFQHSILEGSEDNSGFVLEAGDFVAGVQRVRLDCPPKLAESYATADNPNGVTNARTDFTETAAVAGDLLLNTTTGQSAIITAVIATQLTAGVPFSEDDGYCVLNLTPPVGLLASVTFREDGTSQSNLNFLFVQVGNDVWLEISGLNQPLARLDPVNLGGAEYLYRCQSVQPDGKNVFSVSATFHPGATLYDLSGLVVESDDAVVFG